MSIDFGGMGECYTNGRFAGKGGGTSVWMLHSKTDRSDRIYRIYRMFTARFARGAEFAEKNIFSFFPIESGQMKTVRPACGGN